MTLMNWITCTLAVMSVLRGSLITAVRLKNFEIKKSVHMHPIFSKDVLITHPIYSPRTRATEPSVVTRHYNAIWNAPISQCSKLGVPVTPSHYRILGNKGGTGWNGSIITLFPPTELGLYPYVKDGVVFNGGIPQRVDLSAHLHKAKMDLEEWIPHVDFQGLGVIDWEGWHPLWDGNWDEKTVYRNLSLDLVRQEHPGWPEDRVEAKARRQFETAARAMMQSTVQLMMSLRPRGLWGYYAFPRCDNIKKRTCKETIMRLNDRLLWLFSATSAIFPSAYLKRHSLTHKERENLVYGRIHEAQRLERLTRKRTGRQLPIYVYQRFRFEDGIYYSRDDVKMTASRPKSMGINGIVLWDDHNVSRNTTTCLRLARFVNETLGPVIKDIVT